MKLMKKLFIVSFLLITFAGYGQKINEVFKTMPEDILPGFSEADKTMLLVDTAINVIPYSLGNIERLKYTDSYLQIKTSGVGTLQIKLLPLVNNTKIICVIKTVCGKACDSDIRFYSTDWSPIESRDLMPAFSAESFFDPAKRGTAAYRNALALLDIEPISAAFINGADNLTLLLDYASYISAENVAKIRPFIKQESVTLRWNKTSFRQ